MIQLFQKENCCGCMGCSTVCPHNAISQSIDEKGFIYPVTEPDLCTNCGVCTKLCSFTEKNGQEENVKSVWAYRISDVHVLEDSTSGGVFTALSDQILDNGGMVAGCIMEKDFTVCHILTSDKNERDKMRRSKYVQSDTKDIFNAVKHELQNGRQVMFIGTPCQAAQMAALAGEYRSNLLVCDFLCHGVPNNEFFKAHIKFLEKIYGHKATNYYFRGKKYGWNHMLEEIELENGKILGDKRVQAYSRFFYSGVSLRPSCRNCRYRSTERNSDITIGDFWGIDKILGKTDNRGYSLVMANTSQGQVFAEKLCHSGELISVESKAVEKRVCEPLSECKMDENAFWKLYTQNGYDAVVNRYTDVSYKAAVLHHLKKTIKRILNIL